MRAGVPGRPAHRLHPKNLNLKTPIADCAQEYRAALHTGPGVLRKFPQTYGNETVTGDYLAEVMHVSRDRQTY